MRRLAELTAVAATAVILVATSQARNPCAVERINVAADTTCGPPANVVLSTNSGCIVAATGADFAGLPIGGSIDSSAVDAGLRAGFTLSGANPDGGSGQSCKGKPLTDGGFTINCTPSCYPVPDAGCPGDPCSGTLSAF